MLLQGSLRLSTLTACRAYEDAERGDPEEGTQTYLSGDIHGDSDDPDFIEQARRTGICIGPGSSNIQISNCRSFNEVPDAYVLCASLQRDDTLFAPNFGPYCVEISAPAHFLRHISKLLFRLGKAEDGACAPVVYRDRVYTGLEEMPHPVFVKPTTPYAAQREFRFAWTPIGSIEGPLDLEVRNVAYLCRRVA